MICLQSKIKILLDGEPICLFGESGPVPDEDKYWKRALENINAGLRDVALLILYDHLKANLLERIKTHLLDVRELRLLPLDATAEYLKLLCGEQSFDACGILFTEDETGWNYEYSRKDLSRQSLFFRETFSSLRVIKDLQEELADRKKNFIRINNKLKSIQKKLDR